MVELAPSSESATHRVIDNVLETLAADDTPLPPRIYVDDGDGSWKRFAAMQPVEERRRSVLVAASDESLGDALLYEIGGASRLPVSTPSLGAAFESAAIRGAGPVVPHAAQGILEALLADAPDVHLVGWRPPGFWLRQVGPVRSMRWLAEIAECLEIPPVVLPGPVLVVSGRTTEEIEAVLSQEEDSRNPPSFPEQPGIVILAGSELPSGRGIRIDDLVGAWVVEGTETDRRSGVDIPVMEIPSGRRVGCWSSVRGATVPDLLWRASPAGPQHDGSCWDLAHHDGANEVVRESISLDSEEVSQQSLIRTPGYLGAELRPGSPAGLLIEGLARHPARQGRPIWVPSIDAVGVRFLLGVAGPIWVDGPGVPE